MNWPHTLPHVVRRHFRKGRGNGRSRNGLGSCSAGPAVCELDSEDDWGDVIVNCEGDFVWTNLSIDSSDDFSTSSSVRGDRGRSCDHFDHRRSIEDRRVSVFSCGSSTVVVSISCHYRCSSCLIVGVVDAPSRAADPAVEVCSLRRNDRNPLLKHHQPCPGRNTQYAARYRMSRSISCFHRHRSSRRCT